MPAYTNVTAIVSDLKDDKRTIDERSLKGRTTRARANLAVDVAMGPLFLICAFTGIGAGNGAGESAALMHDASGYLLIILMAVHMALHWKWIVRKTRGMVSLRRGKPLVG